VAEVGGPQSAYGFFARRRRLGFDLSDHDEVGGLADYPNVPTLIAIALSAGQPHVTLRELQTVYSLEDLYDLVEVYLVNAHNARLIAKHRAREREGK
jgi:hypothetical protein